MRKAIENIGRILFIIGILIILITAIYSIFVAHTLIEIIIGLALIMVGGILIDRSIYDSKRII